MIAKLNNNDGYSLGFALVLLVIASITGFALYSYTVSQIKTTKRSQTYIQNRYIVDGSFQEVVADFISSINVGEDGVVTYNDDIKYDCIYSGNLEASESENLNNIKKVVITGTVKEVPTDTPTQKDFLLDVKGDLAQTVNKTISREMTIRVSVDNIYIDDEGNVTYDIYHHIEELKK